MCEHDHGCSFFEWERPFFVNKEKPPNEAGDEDNLFILAI